MYLLTTTPTNHTYRGGSRIFVRGGTRRWSMQGAMRAKRAVARPPRKVLSFRLSEIDSGAFWVSA